LRNLVRDPRIALLFLIPGVGETMRINGRAKISTDPKLTESFVINGKLPRSVLVVTVERAYFQCTKAIIRSKLWDPASIVDRKTADAGGDPRRTDRRQDGRPRARSPRAAAHQRNNLLRTDFVPGAILRFNRARD
jgi:hypothetical protein